MLRLLLHHAGARRLATQALRRLRPPPDPTARDQHDLTRRLAITPTGNETPERALQRTLEERHDARVTVKLDPRGVTLSPRDAFRPAHRHVYPVHTTRLLEDARKLTDSEAHQNQ